MLTSIGSSIHFFVRNTMVFFYAVAKGRVPGIYHTWDECKAQIHQFPRAVFKKFPTSEEAQSFINARACLPTGRLSKGANFVHKRSQYENSTKRLLNSEESTKSDASRPKKRSKTDTLAHSSSSSSTNSTNNLFDMDPGGFVNIYTDGACSSNGYAGAKAGIGVYFDSNSPLNVSEPVIGRATNNTAEIQAITRAAEVAKDAGITKVRIHSDSEFVIKSATQWMPGWKRRGWKTASGTPVINKTDLQNMETALKPLSVDWVHVRGHQGIHGNEMADKLAREGAERYTDD